MQTIAINHVPTWKLPHALASFFPNACPFCTQGKPRVIFQYVPCPFCGKFSSRL